MKLKAIILMLLLMVNIFLLSGCRSTKNCTNDVSDTIIENNIKDSVVIKDSIVIIPIERYVDVVPKGDTLHLETSLAEATVYNDSLGLRGEIHNKNGVSKEIKYKDKIVTKDSIVYKDRIHTEYETVYVENKFNFKVLLWAIVATLMCIVIVARKMYKFVYK